MRAEGKPPIVSGENLKVRATFLGACMLSTLVDSAFIGVWAAAQWALELLLELASVEGPTAWVLVAFKVGFALATLLPILVFIYFDIRLLFERLQGRHKE